MTATAQDRILEALRREIASLGPGTQLPSVRELSRRHQASPVTVSAAVGTLAAEGVVLPRPGCGTFVAERADPERVLPDYDWQALSLGPAAIDPGGLEALMAQGDADTILLSSGFPEEELLPLKALAAATARASRRPGAWGRPPMEGIEELRRWFARDAAADLSAADVLVTSGGQAALATVMRAFGRRGDPIVLESPTYIGGLAAARGAGLIPVPVPVDRDGVRTDLLGEALDRTGARLILLQPTFANPHGSLLSNDRRTEVLGLAREHGAFVIEDDYVRDLWLERPPPPPLISQDRDGHVVYIRSMTKSTAASMRLAAVVSRGPASERLRRARIVDDFFVASVLQHAALELLSSPAWQRHLRQLRRTLRLRRDALIAALAERLPEWRLFQRPPGGLCLWLRLPDGGDERAVVQRAAAAGVMILPGSSWFPAEPPAPHVRLSYAAASEPRLIEAVARIARALS
jgi:DNA-binding transcriptional MocR family regulator